MVAVGPGVLFAAVTLSLQSWEPLSWFLVIGMGWVWPGYTLHSEQKKSAPEPQPAMR